MKKIILVAVFVTMTPITAYADSSVSATVTGDGGVSVTYTYRW